MISVIKIKHDEVAAGGPARLFRSTEPGLADGEQRRDFIWVGDVVDTLLWLNGHAGGERPVQPRDRSGAELSRSGARRVRCSGRAAQNRIHRMPAPLRGQDQSFTQAEMGKLRAAGYPGQFTPLEEGVRRDVRTI